MKNLSIFELQIEKHYASKKTHVIWVNFARFSVVQPHHGDKKTIF